MIERRDAICPTQRAVGAVSAADRVLREVSRAVNRPVGIAGRYRPFYALNALDRLRGRTLHGAVDGRVVLVTGASSGIGEAVARRIAVAGATVLLVARSMDKLDAIAHELEDAGGSAFAHPCDLADLGDVDRMSAEVLAQHGRVDVLVNNAGRSIRRSLELSVGRFHDFERTMQLNYFAAVRLILAVSPGMQERRSGQIVNISSVGVQAGAPRFAGYIASKAALDAFSDAAQAEMQSANIRFTTVYMPLVRTPMIRPTRLYDNMPAISPGDAARMVCDAITYRPRRLGTAVGTAAAVSTALAPWAADRVRGLAYELFPDSEAARGGDDTDIDESAGVLGAVFSRMFPGVHW